MAVARVTSKGQVTIPKEVREKMGISCGDEIEFQMGEEGYLVKKRVTMSPFKKFVGLLKEKKGFDPDEIVEEIRGR